MNKQNRHFEILKEQQKSAQQLHFFKNLQQPKVLNPKPRLEANGSSLDLFIDIRDESLI